MAKRGRRKVLEYGDGKKIPRKDLNEAFEKLNALQGGLCAVCKKPCSTNTALSLDHCHETGRIRGLLCMNCNTGIGRLGDNVEGLQAALDYLKQSL